MFIPQFLGTRQDPDKRAILQRLSPENFTPQHLIWAILEGMARELHDLYSCYIAAGGAPMPLIGSGNGLRKNPHLQSIVSTMFGQKLTMSLYNEEAATGAAIFAQMN